MQRRAGSPRCRCQRWLCRRWNWSQLPHRRTLARSAASYLRRKPASGAAPGGAGPHARALLHLPTHTLVGVGPGHRGTGRAPHHSRSCRRTGAPSHTGGGGRRRLHCHGAQHPIPLAYARGTPWPSLTTTVRRGGRFCRAFPPRGGGSDADGVLGHRRGVRGDQACTQPGRTLGAPWVTGSGNTEALSRRQCEMR
jgi:hypothetical protein